MVRQRGADAAWNEIEYVLFDAPAHGGPFEGRIETCRDVVARAGVVHVRALDNVRCDGIAHLQFPSFVGERIDASLPPAPKPKSKARPAPAPANKPASARAVPAGGERRFELVDARSSKFWSISIAGDEVTTRWGKLGTDGQSKTKSFATEAAARREHDKLIIENTGKGYEEVGE